MSQLSASVEASQTSPVLRRVRRLVIVAVVAFIVYSALTTASRGACASDAGASCLQVELHPSPFITIALAGMVVWALTHALRMGGDEPRALRNIDRTAVAAVVLVVVAIAVSQIWFQLIPISEWDGSGGFLFPFPFPFATVTLTTY